MCALSSALGLLRNVEDLRSVNLSSEKMSAWRVLGNSGREMRFTSTPTLVWAAAQEMAMVAA